MNILLFECLKWIDKHYLRKVKGGFEVVEEIINELPQPDGTKEIILPFEVCSRKT